MRIRFVVNPRASRVSPDEVRRVIFEELGRHDIDLTLAGPRTTRGPQVTDDVLGAAPLDLVVAVGGDGTVHHVINAMARSEIPLGILPAGRANDFARNLGIPLRLRAACRLLDHPSIAHVDLVSVNDRIVATSGGVGLIAAASARAAAWRRGGGSSAWMAARLGAGCYPVAVLRELAEGTGSHRGRLTLRRERRTVAAVVVSNLPRFGRWFRTGPRSSSTDGGFRLCVVDAPCSRRRLLGVCGRAAMGIMNGDGGVSITTLRRHALSFAEETDFFGDGEHLMRGRDFEIRLLPRAVKVVVTPVSPLVEVAGDASWSLCFPP